MGKRDRYRKSINLEDKRWGQKYRSFPGVGECVRLLLDVRVCGYTLEIIKAELVENASRHLEEMIDAFHNHKTDRVAIFMLMVLELAALPESVDFLATVLRDDNPDYRKWAQMALEAINTRESRTALFNAKDSE